MNAEIITIGDELLIGQVINTNQAFIAEKFNSIGIDVKQMTTVGDNEHAILEAISTGFTRSDIIALTGGLGPTHDDITRATLCKFFDTDLVENENVLLHIKKLLSKRNITLTKLNQEQALVPRNCTVIENQYGTAPGMLFEQNGKYLFALPGVPYEMKAMLENWLLPFFEKKVSGNVILHHTLKTTGIPEALLAEKIGDVKNILDKNTTLAFLPNPTGTKLRITVKEKNKNLAEEKIHHIEKLLRNKIEHYIYSSDEKDLEEVLQKIFTEKKLTLATAESCTGGIIANRITNVSGSSEYFLRGYITYSNNSKIELLDVPKKYIENYGAVSKEVAEVMAKNARIKSQSDIAISTTGIAGPTGGTSEKPVGAIWIGYSDKKETIAYKFLLGENRLRFKERASQTALEILRRKLLGIEIESIV